MHLVVRVSDDPLRLFADARSPEHQDVAHAVVGGPRSRHYVRDVSTRSRSVGALLLPGTSSLLFPGHAYELAERHTALDDLWGREADRLRDRLGAQRTLERAVELLELALLSRLPRVRKLHPAVAAGLERLARGGVSVSEVVRASGKSHRHFVELYRREVGLTPKVHGRIERLQRTLLALGRPGSLADVALSLGFADQAHMNREFAEIAGASPGEVRRAGASSHVPIGR